MSRATPDKGDVVSMLLGVWLGAILVFVVGIHLQTRAKSLWSVTNLKIEQCEANLPRNKHCALVAVEDEQ